MILRAAVLLFLGFIVGAYVAYPKKELRSPTPQTPVAETPTVTQNKLFSFFDTFTADKDMGTARIEFMYPEEHLMLISYPTSQETLEYGVYDYQRDILYPRLGSSTMDDSIIPQAFVGNDKLLVYYSGSSATPPTIDIVDFHNQQIKELFINRKLYQVFPKYGDLLHLQMDNANTPKMYQLNPETLEVTEAGPPKG